MTRAIVIGASIGGLLIARALVDHVDEVLVLDRDTPPSEPAARRGVGQGSHAHLLLDSGRQAMESLLPGLFDELRADGANEADVGLMRWYHAGYYKVREELGMRISVQSRPFLEHHVRRRVGEIEGIELRYGVSCKGLEAEGGRVTGVRAQEGEGEVERLSADIVIIAAGRGKQALKWAEELGVPAPPEDNIKINIGYSSRYYQDVPEMFEGCPTVIAYSARPRSRLHALAFRVEHQRVCVTLMGYHGEHPPRDEAGYRAWFDKLETTDIARFIDRAEPLTEVYGFRAPVQYRRHWHRVALPEGLAVFGDSACGFDPVFGQGMSVVATQAAGLAELLARGPFKTKKVQRMVMRKTLRPWLITAIEASRYAESAPDVRRLFMKKLLQRFLNRVYAVSAHDPVVYQAFLDVIFLHRDAAWLARPGILARLMRPLPKDVVMAPPAAILDPQRPA